MFVNLFDVLQFIQELTGELWRLKRNMIIIDQHYTATTVTSVMWIIIFLMQRVFCINKFDARLPMASVEGM